MADPELVGDLPNNIDLSQRGHAFLAEIYSVWAAFDQTRWGTTMRHLVAAYSDVEFYWPKEQLDDLGILIAYRFSWTYCSEQEYDPFSVPEHEAAIAAARERYAEIYLRHYRQAVSEETEEDFYKDGINSVEYAARLVPPWMKLVDELTTDRLRAAALEAKRAKLAADLAKVSCELRSLREGIREEGLERSGEG